MAKDNNKLPIDKKCFDNLRNKDEGEPQKQQEEEEEEEEEGDDENQDQEKTVTLEETPSCDHQDQGEGLEENQNKGGVYRVC